jgi:hypothetical protein
METSYSFFEIKKGRKWTMVQASSMKAINEYCKNNDYSDWRMVGMQSTEQLKYNKQNTPVVA